MTSFAEMEFIFRFFPIFLILFYAVPKRFKEITLLTGSLIFYAMGDFIFLPILLAATGLNYGLGCLKEKRVYRIAGIVIDVLLLVLFKFQLTHTDMHPEMLPLGMSFYLFKMIAWQADLLRGKITRKPTFKEAAVYFCMFPQILSGPIMRYEEGGFGVVREYRLEKAEDGFKYFVMGFGMKVLLADRLAVFWNDMLMIGFSSISTPLAWLGMFSWSLRLYFDFWGYSLMAAGIGMMVGFAFIPNFDHPYAATSISDFYRRWHITLGRWFRDYVYIPMGGSRVGKDRVVLNLLIVWFLTGLWHGSGVHFLIWGFVLGILIISEKLWTGHFLKEHRFLGHLYVLLLIPLTWVIFAVEDMRQLGIYFTRLFPFWGTNGYYINQDDFVHYLKAYGILLVAGVLLCVPSVFRYYEKYKSNILVILLLSFLFWLCVYFAVGQEGNPFIYLNF